MISCERKPLKARKAAMFGVQFTPAVSADAKKQLMRIKFLVAAGTQSGKNMSPVSSAETKTKTTISSTINNNNNNMSMLISRKHSGRQEHEPSV